MGNFLNRVVKSFARTSRIGRHAGLIVVLAVVATGCASTGNQQLKGATRDQINHQIVQGKTTKDDVRRMYGDPMAVRFTEAGHEMWGYGFSKATPTVTSFVPVVALFSRGADVERRTLLVLFDERGVVEKVAFSRSETKSRRGIAE
ncbi:outer membrane protein assembly factor BamE [Burkholderia sp. MBR-1]|uniref:outer membrane protein assembly factor BamE n=1 Tax=Burkholderia sp. MBR-1 TaxID=2732364 RepID=UPI0015EFC660|nr:outer membrane protein assembly factor BamE [Burkholderia sp. MBR-1]QMI49741.1 outer membrane protein assembly factor BamE [Burkholderia sp. MBR-1]